MAKTTKTNMASDDNKNQYGIRREPFVVAFITASLAGRQG